MKYGAKRGLPGGVSPQIAGEHIETIRKKVGYITPEMLVLKSKAKSSPLHDCFTWDDKEAGKKQRVNEARYLLRMVTVEIETDEDEFTVTRAFVSVSESTEYQTIATVMGDEDMRSQLLQQALQELRSFKQKYAQLRELATVFAAIDKI